MMDQTTKKWLCAHPQSATIKLYLFFLGIEHILYAFSLLLFFLHINVIFHYCFFNMFRFKIPIRVQDPTGVISLTLFDGDANKLFRKKCTIIAGKF